MHVVTVWFIGTGGRAKEEFEAAHMSVIPLTDGWSEVVLMDENWDVIGVEQFRQAYRVSVRKIAAEDVDG